jgi:hypothetical protein
MESEAIRWHCTTRVRKFKGDVDTYRRRFGKQEGERRFFAEHAAYADRTIKDNVLLREGIQELWNLLVGETATVYSEANARIGVGDSDTTAVDTQTALQGGNTAFAAMDAGFPVVGALADKKVTFQATFGEDVAEFAWKEWTIDNGSSANKNLNRKVASLGTKDAGSWMLQVSISLA